MYNILQCLWMASLATSSNVILSSLQVNDHFACPGEVVYTCEIYGHGSHAIAWSSDNYIGTGGVQLLFTAQVHDVGSVLRSATVPTTFAILTINNQSNAFLKSELHIIVPPNSPPGSVRCHDIANAIYTTGFQVIADPSMPQSVNALQSQYCEVKMCTITALWHSPRNANEAQVTGYRVFANGSFVTNQTIQSNTSNVNETRISSSILTIFPVPYCAAHMISVSAVNRCGREGKRSSILILDPENTLTLPVTCNPTDSAMRNDRCLLVMFFMMMAIQFMMIKFTDEI